MELGELAVARILSAASNYGTPLVIGLSGPQGCGKTTLGPKLVEGLAPLKTAVISLDDFYITFEEQKELFHRTASELWQYRGLPGTHDLGLLQNVVENVQRRLPVASPIFEKHLNGGRGDRISDTRTLEDVDVLILEGWMVGFEALADGELEEAYLKNTYSRGYTSKEIHRLNDWLRGYSAIWDLVGGFIVIETDRVENVCKWRAEQEHTTSRTAGKPTLSDSQVSDYVRRFMPAYELYRCRQGKQILRVEIDIARKIKRIM